MKDRQKNFKTKKKKKNDFYNINAVFGNTIIYNRKYLKSANGFEFGNSGSGKAVLINKTEKEEQ